MSKTSFMTAVALLCFTVGTANAQNPPITEQQASDKLDDAMVEVGAASDDNIGILDDIFNLETGYQLAHDLMDAWNVPVNHADRQSADDANTEIGRAEEKSDAAQEDINAAIADVLAATDAFDDEDWTLCFNKASSALQKAGSAFSLMTDAQSHIDVAAQILGDLLEEYQVF